MRMRYEAILELYDECSHVVDDIPYNLQEEVIEVDEELVAARAEQMWQELCLSGLRRVRDAKLAETDFWMFSDRPTPTQEQLDYRQALRDITATYSSLDDVVWPVKP